MSDKGDKVMTFNEQYRLGEVLGRGAFSVVYKCVKIDSEIEFAVKVIKKEKLSIREIQKLDTEARICRKLDHPNIVKLNQVVSENKIHYFIFDLVTGGELFDDLVTRTDNYTEEMTSKCMTQMLDTVKYCHDMGVVHRDLKPENILLESKANKVIKIADFGLALEVGKNEIKWFGKAGTPSYMAPEVVERKPYGRPVDVWACGVIMYILLAGYHPFPNENEMTQHNLIRAGDYDLSAEIWSQVTDEGKDLITRLMCVVPHRRLTAAEALQHPWFQKVKTAKKIHSQNTVDNLIEFNAKRKFKAVVHSSIFIHKFMPGRRRLQPSGSETPSSSSNQGSKSNKSGK